MSLPAGGRTITCCKIDLGDVALINHILANTGTRHLSVGGPIGWVAWMKPARAVCPNAGPGGGVALILLALLLTTATPAVAAPNIVILLADDWGFTDVGAFGGEMATPNIDALARAGTRFANFHTAGSCAPTRAMLQTGVPSHRAGLGNMPETMPPEHAGKWGYDNHLTNRVETIADRLRAAGYRTYLTGKWHLGHTPDTLPTAHGYDHAFALSQSGADNFEEKPNLLLYDRADWTEDAKPAHLPRDYYSSRFIIDKAMAYIDAGAASGKPFLASINFLANHIPVQASDADIAAYAHRYDAGWRALRAQRAAGAVAAGIIPAGTPMAAMSRAGPPADAWDAMSPAERAQRARAMAAYGGMATAMDREIGRLVAHLKATDAYNNTIFVFLSDNGPEAIDPMIGINGLSARYYYNQAPDQQGRPGSLTAVGRGWASTSAAPLNGYKFTASEGGVRVPLIIAWPGNPALRQGSVARGFAHVTDVTPTLLALAGVAATVQPAGIEPVTGASLVPMLHGAAAVHPPGEAIGYELSGNAVVWKGDWKLVKNLPPYGDGQWQLFDIVNDPGETHNRAGAEPARLAAMKSDYAAYAARDHVLPMPKGYTAPTQIQMNAVDELLLPRLKTALRAALPWLVGGMGLIIGGIVAWRRRGVQPG